jgi:hypothetical protein
MPHKICWRHGDLFADSERKNDGLPPSSELFVSPIHFVILRLISLYSFCSPPSSRVTSALSPPHSLILHRVPRPYPVIVALFARSVVHMHHSAPCSPLIPSLLLVFYSSGIARSVVSTSPKTRRRRSVVLSVELFVDTGRHAPFDRPAFPRHDRAAVRDPCPHCGASVQQNRDGIEM